ncbi:U3-containing 90S pre-ribosomal complex subunit [Aspergillus parasiticus SU-1]|uniref:U3-containing 90S pre-ribosomal complex subunit-domain containing protein n=3 Tax=Aspergillus subgen. Circumdati TaxID=2720871 RepID=A0A5N6DS77_ASPPA|nr:U3-containing 90S pre-ribosomal complex subunit-domain containing protein [Aspergillus parasiticus]KAE8315659.1 U3-containing 90S pre-ribosomal complex subunit-domain containing protein [Aspergillus transmontanensis]KJK67748.1 U3-containing 90S pre-ribosomal complex subunit [Aspergillus parasiticus SU-1]
MSTEAAKSSGLSAKIDNKRKRQAEESSKQAGAATGNADGPSNKKRKNGKSKPKKGGKDKKDKPQQDASEKEQRDTKQTETKGGIDEAIGKMDGRLLADHFMQKAKRHNKELTAVELSDLSVPESSFLDTSSFDLPRQLEKLPAFLKAFSPKGSDLSKSSEEKGTPHTLVVCASGLRAADAVRALRTFQTKESPIGKLFAKHIKLEEAKQFLERSRIAIGGGTPARISDLIDTGSLKLGELQRIVIDGSYVDQKQRGIFDMKETHLPLLKLLTRSEFRERYGAEEKRIQILIF